MPEHNPHLRISDIERSTALNRLGTHYADGRLNDTEFDERTRQAATANTVGELSALFGDLPGGLPLDADGLPSATAALPAVQDSSAEPSPRAGRHAQPDAVPADPQRELAELRERGKKVEMWDYIIVGITLVAFLVGQFVLDLSASWIVWPSLFLTCSIPRFYYRYTDDEEDTYELLKKTQAKERRERLKRAQERNRELGMGQDG